MWNDILSRINDVSKIIQTESIDLSTVVDLLNSLKEYIQSLRSKFDYYNEAAKELTKCGNYRDNNKRIRKVSTKLTFFYSSTENMIFQGKDKFKIEVFMPIIDKLLMELERRSTEYTTIFARFGFISNILDIDKESIIKNCEKLCENYPNDFDASVIAPEFIHFKLYVEPKAKLDVSIKKSIKNMYQLLYTDKLLSVFPNVEVAMQIFLSILPTNCSGERPFSRLALIKNDFRSTMTQKKLNEYSVCIENNLLKSIHFDDIISDFVSKKVRNKPL